MSLEQNKAIVRQCYKVADQGNLEQAKEMIAPNIVVHLMSGSVIRGSDDFFKYVQMMHSTFPDGYHTFEEVIAEEDKVVSYGTFTDTHRREFLGVPSTGKQVAVSIVEVDRLGDGKIVEHWELFDSLTMLQQLRGKNLV